MRIYICGCTCMGDDGNHKTMSHECRDKQLPFAFNSCFRFFFYIYFFLFYFCCCCCRCCCFVVVVIDEEDEED